MLWTSLKIQMNIMFRKKEYKAAIIIGITYSCLSFIYILTQFWGMDLSLIKDANQSVCYSQDNRLWYFFSVIYPFLVVLPYATSYVDDYRNQLLPIYISRSSRKNYFFSKLMAAFIGTGAVIAIPCLLNLFLCNLFLPHNHNTWLGEYQMGNYYRRLLGTNILYNTPYSKLPFLKLWTESPFLYNLLYLLFFSLFSGLLGALVLSFSFWWKRSKLVLFLPIFLLTQISQNYDTWKLSDAIANESTYVNTNILDYVVPTISKGRTPLFMAAFVLICIILIGVSVLYAIREDLRSMQWFGRRYLYSGKFYGLYHMFC